MIFHTQEQSFPFIFPLLSTSYLLSFLSVLLGFPAIFMASSPSAAPEGTRRAIAVIAGALNDIDEKRKYQSTIKF